MSSTEKHEQSPLAASQNGEIISEEETTGAGLIKTASLASSGAESFEDSKDLQVAPDKQKESVNRYLYTNNMEDVKSIGTNTNIEPTVSPANAGAFSHNKRRYSE